jgi:hypothetical protein
MHECVFQNTSLAALRRRLLLLSATILLLRLLRLSATILLLLLLLLALELGHHGLELSRADSGRGGRLTSWRGWRWRCLAAAALSARTPAVLLLRRPLRRAPLAADGVRQAGHARRLGEARVGWVERKRGVAQ